MQQSLDSSYVLRCLQGGYSAFSQICILLARLGQHGLLVGLLANLPCLHWVSLLLGTTLTKRRNMLWECWMLILVCIPFAVHRLQVRNSWGESLCRMFIPKILCCSLFRCVHTDSPRFGFTEGGGARMASSGSCDIRPTREMLDTVGRTMTRSKARDIWSDKC